MQQQATTATTAGNELISVAEEPILACAMGQATYFPGAQAPAALAPPVEGS